MQKSLEEQLRIRFSERPRPSFGIREVSRDLDLSSLKITWQWRKNWPKNARCCRFSTFRRGF